MIELVNISKKYNKKLVVEGINFKIMPSTITVLIGPNGAGKSTIARILSGLELPSSGSVLRDRSTKIVFVPQFVEPNKEIPMRASDLARVLGVKKEDFVGKLYQNLEQIDMFWDKQLQELSAGQLQLFMIAQAFAQNPDLVVLDEPTAFLDIDFATRFYDFIKIIKKDVSLFIISHELHSVINFADQVLCINHHICCSGKPFLSNSEINANIGEYRHNHNHKHF